jgi:hypothetical protein
MIDSKEFTAPVVLLYHPTSRRKAALILADGFSDERYDGWGRGVYLGGTTSESHHREVLIVALQVAPEDLWPHALTPEPAGHERPDGAVGVTGAFIVPAYFVNRHGVVLLLPHPPQQPRDFPRRPLVKEIAAMAPAAQEAWREQWRVKCALSEMLHPRYGVAFTRYCRDRADAHMQAIAKARFKGLIANDEEEP